MLRVFFLNLLMLVSTFVSATELVDMKYALSENWAEQLRNGFILTSESSDPLQLFTLLGAERFSPSVHIGVVEVVGDDVYVYDTNADIGKYYLEGKSPSDTMKGRVRRQKLRSFLEKAEVINIFSIPSEVNAQKLVAFVKRHWMAGTPFDPYFDLHENEKLYCSELIALALRHAGGRVYPPVRMRANRSLDVIRRWMRIDATQFLFPYSLVETRNWIGTVSVRFNQQTLLLDRLIKYELYRRFTRNQKIGNVLQRSGINVTVKENIRQFALEVDKLQPENDLNVLYGKVRKIADQVLGEARGIPDQPLPRCQLIPRLCTLR